jgi:hypothetical protein
MKMAKASGFILRLPPDRRDEFSHNLSLYESFAEPVHEFIHSRNAPLICFIIANGDSISHVGLGKRGMRAGSGLRRLNISSIQELSPPIAITDLLANLPAKFAATVRKRIDGSGLLPPKTFEQFVDTLIRIAPQTRPLIEQYGNERRSLVAGLSQKVSSALAEQKEAIATALALAGIDREPLQQWSPVTTDTQRSFLDGLVSARLREDPMIINDLMVLPGHELLRTLPYGAAVFQGEGQHVTVILANRQPLEETFGTDLIYYNETFKSFLMVQYKAMEREGHEAIFRLPNEDLAKELDRMGRVLEQLGACSKDDNRDSFRLTENPFFLKFCPRLILNPDDKGLVPGMYLPFDYWRLTENDTALQGSRGGRLLTYKNVGRYFDNSSFISLVANAWVGTTISQSATLEPIIREIIESGRAVAVAIKRIEPAEPITAEGVITDYDPTEGMNLPEDGN